MKLLFRSYVVVALTAFVASACAHDNVISTSKMEAFKTAHPKARFHGQQYFDNEGFFEQTRTSNMIYGTVLSTGTTAQESAWNFYNEIEGIYANEVGELQPQHWPDGNVLQGVMWNRDTQQHKFYTFRFEQVMNDVPVFRSGIGFLVRNEKGYPLVLSGNNLKEMGNFDVANLDVKPVVTDVMKRNAAVAMSAPNIAIDSSRSLLLDEAQQQRLPVEVSDASLVIWAGNTNTPVKTPEVAVQFYATQGSRKDFASYRRYFVVAAVDDGEVLLAETQVHSFDVNGTVTGEASEGDAALECEPLVNFALPYAEVSISGGNTVFADVDGNFNIPSNVGGTVTVNSRLEGMYFDLFDEAAGGSTPVISINVADPGSVDFVHNESGAEFSTANVNAYLHSNIVRDFVLDIEPSFPTIGIQTGFDINTNINSSCNAFYDGSSINFFRNGGGCFNTSYADVVYHEYGHHLVNVTGNDQGQFGEGCSDVMGVILEDNPELAVGFFGDCNGFLRSAENFRTYPCSGGIHDCGQLISGCVWDTINEIRAIDPDNAVDIVSRLFVGMLPVRGATGGSSTIGPEITIIFLELDDDDGDIGNGTPHYTQIAAAFNAHNMMAPDLNWISLSFPNGRPETISPAGGTSFQVDVASAASEHMADSGILHVDTGNGFVEYPMTVIDADSYLATFPAVDCDTDVQYFVTVDAVNGETQTSPSGAPMQNTFSTFSAFDLDLAFDDDFETDMGWTVSGTASTGLWERGVPAGGGDRNDPPTDADGSGSCYVTENEAGNSDVDDGTSILTSPIMDATVVGDEVAYVTYYRWYNNGDSDDPFTVEISNDGGANWETLEVVGPAGPETEGGWILKRFSVADVLAPTDNMRLRFTAEDFGGLDIVEAGIDGVAIQVVSCEADVLHGDVNLDGTVNLLDVAPFVQILQDGGFQAEADVNKDGVVDLLDVAPFIDLL